MATRSENEEMLARATERVCEGQGYIECTEALKARARERGEDTTALDAQLQEMRATLEGFKTRCDELKRL